MSTVFFKNKISTDTLFCPTDVIKPIDGFPEICVSTFSKEIIDRFASLDGSEIIAYLCTANGKYPIYQTTYGGKKIAFYLSLVGAPACVSCFEEVIAMGAKKFVFFGCCGVLGEEKVQNHMIVPTAAVRDEGTSYHYAAPQEELRPNPSSTAILKDCLAACGYSYVEGKIWTTDAIYRETIELIKERRQEGCIAVEMEYSALLAAAAYRNVPFIQFLYGADALREEEWQPNDLTDYGRSHAENYMKLAFTCGLALDNTVINFTHNGPSIDNSDI